MVGRTKRGTRPERRRQAPSPSKHGTEPCIAVGLRTGRRSRGCHSGRRYCWRLEFLAGCDSDKTAHKFKVVRVKLTEEHASRAGFVKLVDFVGTNFRTPNEDVD